MTPRRIKEWAGLAGVAGAIMFWLFTIYGLPARVEKLESAVKEHERKLTESGVKIDIILDDVKTIKTHILTIHGGRQ